MVANAVVAVADVEEEEVVVEVAILVAKVIVIAGRAFRKLSKEAFA